MIFLIESWTNSWFIQKIIRRRRRKIQTNLLNYSWIKIKYKHMHVAWFTIFHVHKKKIRRKESTPSMAIFRKSGNFYHRSILLQLPPILHQWPCLGNPKLLPPSFYTCLIGGAYLVINLWWIQNNKNVYHFWPEQNDRSFRQGKLNQSIDLYVYIYTPN